MRLMTDLLRCPVRKRKPVYELLQQKPNIFQHVPLKIIASYLGIKDSSLSRIRRESVISDFFAFVK
jgi:hypothetical protein